MAAEGPAVSHFSTARTAMSRPSSIGARSLLRIGASRYSEPPALISRPASVGALPTPMRTRIQSSVPSAAETDLTPLCPFAEPNGAQRECQLVVEDDEVLVFELQLVEQGHDRKPAQVHEGLGLGEQDVVSCKPCTSGLGLASPVGDRNVADSGDAIDGHETCVVRRVQVFEAGVAETDDELHNRDQGLGIRD